MPTLLPSDLRTGRLRFLLDLDWSGQVYRLAEDELEPTIDGSTLRYFGGLSFGGSWEDRLDLFSVSPTSRSLNVTLELAGIVNVPQRVADGYPLGAATATLSLWAEGTTEAHTLLVGDLRQVEYGAEDEPVTATIEEAPLLSPGLIPGELARIAPPAYNVPTVTPKIEGQFYPIVFGRPGGPSGFGSPALTYSTLINVMSVVIAGHEVTAGNATIINDDDGTSESRPVEIIRDGAGNTHAKITTTAAAVTIPSANSEPAYYIRWTTAGGVPSRSDPSAPMRGAGEILTWLLQRSGARVDYGRMTALEPQIAGFRLDAAIIPGADARVSPLEWVQQHMLPILPLSAHMSGDGLHYTYWDWAATTADAVVSLNADDHQLERVGAVEYSDRDDLYQQIQFDYARDYQADTFQSRLTYTGNRALAAADPTVVLDQRMEWAFRRYANSEQRLARTLEISSEVVLDDATAHLVCQYLARRHGLQSRLIRYEADPEFAWLEPGNVVSLTDEDLALTAEAALVESVVWTDSETVGLALRLLGRPDLR